MKKSFKFLLLLSIGVAASSFLSSKKATNVNAASDEIDTKLGPGLINHNAPNWETGSPDNYRLSFRGGGETYNLMLYPNHCDYSEVPFGSTLTDKQMANSDFSMIKIYTDEENYYDANYFIETSLTNPSINIYQDIGVNLSISFVNSGVYCSNIYKVVIEEGFVYPNYYESTTKKYVQQETQILVNPFYGNTEKTELYNEWIVEKVFKNTIYYDTFIGTNTQKSPGGVSYFCHIRDRINGPDQTIDSGNCFILFFFDLDQYNSDLTAFNVPVVTKYLNNYNFFDKVKCVMNDDAGTIITLGEACKGKDEFTYNTFGEKGTFGIKIGNDGHPGTTNYNGSSFKSIIIESGAEFPSYATTNGESTDIIKYVQKQAVVMKNIKLSPNFNDNFQIEYDVGSTKITGVNAINVNETIDGISLNKTFVVLNLENYDDENNRRYCKFLTHSFIMSIFVNGRSLKSLNNSLENSHAIFNISGAKTFGFSVDKLSPEDVKEVIISYNCPIPSSSNTQEGFDKYKTASSYVNQATVSFSRKSSSESFTEDSSITWTVWFDDISFRVKHDKYFYIDEIPQGQDKENARFVEWLDENGFKIAGDFKVKTCREFHGYYIYSHKVTVIIDENKTENYTVDHNKRLTSLTNPTKDGYIFECWLDENNNFFNPDNLISNDITIKAKWIKSSIEETKKGCGGSIIASSFAICFASLTGIALILKKKKEN